MEETKEFQSNVIAITSASRKFNSSIGNYIKHYVTNKGNTVFIVELNNGTIEMSRVFAMDGLATLDDEIKKTIASTFKPKQ